MGSNAEVAGLEFLVEPLDRSLESGALERESEVTEPPVEQLLVRALFPCGRARHGWSLSHDPAREA